MQVYDQVRNIIAEECFLTADAITDNALFSDLGVDSLAQIQIWVRIGQEFQVEVPEPDSDFWSRNSVACLSDVVAIIERMKGVSVSNPADDAAEVRFE
jgi:acyl carrier protein